jgi:hypothetical protein
MAQTDSNGGNGARDARGQFAPGNRGGPGNPHLRHAAALQRAVREAVTGDELQKVLRKLRDQALEGDTAAARLLIERCIGKASDEPRMFSIDVGDISTTVGVLEAMRRVTAACAAGDVGVNDAAAVASLLRQTADASTFLELEQRIEAIEGARP